MNKRFLGILLAVFLIFALCACGSEPVTEIVEVEVPVTPDSYKDLIAAIESGSGYDAADELNKLLAGQPELEGKSIRIVPDECGKLLDAAETHDYESTLSELQRLHGVTPVEGGVIKVELDEFNFWDFFDLFNCFLSAEKDSNGEYSYVERSAFYRLKDVYTLAEGYPEPDISVTAHHGEGHYRIAIHDYDLETWNMGISVEEICVGGIHDFDDYKLKEWIGYEALADACQYKNGVTFWGIQVSWDSFHSSGNGPLHGDGNYQKGYDCGDYNYFENASGTLYLTVD